MRATYWSNSKFASRVRKAFGLPQEPASATAEGWEEFRKLENSISPFGVKLIESFDTAQNIVYWVRDSIDAISYYISNYINGSHILKTSVKRGGWGDLTSKIPDALMYSIIDFVEKECFWMNVAFASKKPEDMSEAAWDYKNQGYIKRKLFPSKVTNEERAFHGLQYIAFQMENCEGAALTDYQELIDAYNFAKNRYFTFDAYEESGYMQLPREEGFMRITDEQRECFKIINKLEEDFATEVTKHCFAIVKHRDYLWT